jgi:hypothetical protein
VVRGGKARYWASWCLASAGIFAALVHGALLLGGGVEFRAPVSISLLAAIGAVSIAQLWTAEWARWRN